MRRRLIIGTMLLSAALTVTGCMQNTGDVGNKNIRPNSGRTDRILGNGTMKSRFANDQRNEMNRINGNQRNNNNVIGLHGNSHMQMSDAIANHLAAMPEIDAAYVVMTDRNAYVAVTQNNKGGGHVHGTGLSNSLKTKIADNVKSMSTSTQNVYVSANPDFASRMRNFAEETRQGHPIQGFLSEFNALVERIFPAESSRSPR
ncbi:YhcN/YlaJ family sporulation lipoprotein [Cohnella panacarvi]|uniref:YhcN/YlaJ family sporulation lipoprotein n=1 Tax=Cohnella panacarvi TaxID=400776 RepID=UPI00047D4FD6|nr:YhcN/YlaJ family sporulation lipoprotein [Cohnella panacarvi]